MAKLKVILFLLFIITVQNALAEIDWTMMSIKVSATDKMTALDLLRKDLYMIQYDNNMFLKDLLRDKSALDNQLMQEVSKSQTLKQNYMTDGSIEYVYNLDLTGKIMSLVLPEKKSQKLVVPMLCPCCGQEWPENKVVPEGIQLEPKQIVSVNYTGIVIDCRGYILKPCLFPVIYNSNMQEIYSINFADPDHVIERGLVLYSSQELYNNPRIGNNPLIIKATGVVNSNKTDIKVSASDARLIHGSKSNVELLQKCRFAIIFGP